MPKLKNKTNGKIFRKIAKTQRVFENNKIKLLNLHKKLNFKHKNLSLEKKWKTKYKLGFSPQAKILSGF